MTDHEKWNAMLGRYSYRQDLPSDKRATDVLDFARSLLGPDELTQLRADIDRTAAVVQALGTVFSVAGPTAYVIGTPEDGKVKWPEVCAEAAHLRDLRARERELIAPPKEQPATAVEPEHSCPQPGTGDNYVQATVRIDKQGVWFGTTWISFDTLSGWNRCNEINDGTPDDGARAAFYQHDAFAKGLVAWANAAHEDKLCSRIDELGGPPLEREKGDSR